MPQAQRGLQKLLHVSGASRRPWTNPNEVKRCTSTWGQPLKWQREAEKAGEYKSVFACSYSDFFLPEADGWRDDAWALIRQTPNLIWQLASKRTHLIAERLPTDWGDGYKNVWLGTSAELKKYLPRLDTLRKIPCVLRWVDFAPTLEDLMPELSEHIDGFGWVNASGETGCGSLSRGHSIRSGPGTSVTCAKRREFRSALRHVAGRHRYPDRHLDGVIYNEIPPLMPKSENKPGGLRNCDGRLTYHRDVRGEGSSCVSVGA